MRHLSLHWSNCVGGNIFFMHQFFEKHLNFWGFSICSSFGRQLCQKCGWKGQELYVRTHIAKLLCLCLYLESLFKKIWPLMLFCIECCHHLEKYFFYLFCVQPSFVSNLSQLIKKYNWKSFCQTKTLIRCFEKLPQKLYQNILFPIQCFHLRDVLNLSKTFF